MSKSYGTTVATIQRQVVDTNTGQVLEMTTEKTFVKKMNKDQFYFTYCTFLGSCYSLKPVGPMNLLAWLMSNVHFNTNVVHMNTKNRLKCMEDLDIKSNSFYKYLNLLKEQTFINEQGDKEHIITVDEGDISINPAIAWKGDPRQRSNMSKQLEVTFKYKDIKN